MMTRHYAPSRTRLLALLLVVSSISGALFYAVDRVLRRFEMSVSTALLVALLSCMNYFVLVHGLRVWRNLSGRES